MSLQYLDALLTIGGREPHKVARNTLLLMAILYYGPSFARFLRQNNPRSIRTMLHAVLYRIGKKVPMVRAKMDQNTNAAIESIAADFRKPVMNEPFPYQSSLPEKGMSQSDLSTILSRWNKAEVSNWTSQQISGTVYHGSIEFQKFLNNASGLFSFANPLHGDVFPYCRRMEQDVIRMACSLFNGDKDSCGCMSSGGTESIILAMKAYRDRARKEHGISVPEILGSFTIHAAFDKAAMFMGMKLVHVDCDPITQEVDLRQLERSISSRTAVIIGSCPNYPHGVRDPLKEMSEIALKHNIGFHVDCCLGGFLVPFLNKIGYKNPPSDFRLPGVTSISADTHKYGFSPKGTSVVMYRNKELRKYQYSLSSEWTGGIYATATIPGSRAGGPIAATWASMMAMGQSGYIDCVRAIMETWEIMKNGIPKIRGLELIGTPFASVLSFRSTEKKMSIFVLSDALKKRGWSLAAIQKPAGIHITVTYLHRNLGEKFLDDLAEAVEETRNSGAEEEGTAQLYGVADRLPIGSGVLDDLMIGFLDCYFDTV